MSVEAICGPGNEGTGMGAETTGYCSTTIITIPARVYAMPYPFVHISPPPFY